MIANRFQYARLQRIRKIPVIFSILIFTPMISVVILWHGMVMATRNTSSGSCNDGPQRSMDGSWFRGATRPQQAYIPAPVEKYILDHLQELGWYDENNPKGCTIWNDPSHPLFNDLQLYLKDLDTYQKLVRNFPEIPFDLRVLKRNTSMSTVCEQVRLSPGGMKEIFATSGQLSLSSSGYVEPLTTPMRHPRFCTNRQFLMNMNYMVHDFEAMCYKIQPTSTTVLIDMGASLSFHTDQSNKLLHVTENPILYLLRIYKQFGIHFDHIYGFEAKFTSPDQVYQNLLPEEYMSSYHWINTGVQSEKDGKLNPLHSILRKFTEDDFVVIKLDIDTAQLEIPLARQLLQDASLAKLVDQFYFEHHVHMKEMARIWRSAMQGSLRDTFELFHGLRQQGVPAHFWI